MQGFRRAAVHLALVALLLRAFLPVGWMPNPAGFGETALVLCTMDAPFHQAGHAPGKPSPDDGHSHDECPFAAAPHMAAPLAVAVLVPPPALVQFYETAAAVAVVLQPADYSPQSPRAPPSLI